MITTKINFKLDEQKLKNIENFLGKNHLVNVGVLANEVRPDGFGSVELAMVHEFGSEKMKIPKRSFFIKTMTSRMKDYENDISANLPIIIERIADGKGDQFLQKVGAMWVAYVMDTFDAEGPGWDKLSDYTLMKRRNFSIVKKEHPNLSMEKLLMKTSAGTKILQDTGEMKKSVTFKVIE